MIRRFLSTTIRPQKEALVLGMMKPNGAKDGVCLSADLILGSLTPTAQSVIRGLSPAAQQRLIDAINYSGFRGKSNEIQNFFNINDVESSASIPPVLTIAGLGEKSSDMSAQSRNASSLAARSLRQMRIRDAQIEPMFCEHSVSEGVALGQYSFDKYLSESSKMQPVSFSLFKGQREDSSETEKSRLDWATGQFYATAQNAARDLMNFPANYLTPLRFSEFALEQVKDIDGVEVNVRTREWIEEQGMNAFLAVANGSDQPPCLLDFLYQGVKHSSAPEIALVGKGITFDSGGISIKPAKGMGMMKGDMGGAAVCLSVFSACAKMKLPINLRLVVPLCENMPSGKSMRPGDIVKAMNGKSIEIDNTDAEGRLILADAIYYATVTNAPKILIDVATLTGAMDVALGSVYTGVFSNQVTLFNDLESAGVKMDDPFWRMPLHKNYGKQIKSPIVDLVNTGSKGAGSCTAAMFLKEFLADENSVSWAHLDIAGVMHTDSTSGHLVKGMSGRPTRSLIEFIREYSYR